MIGTRVSHYQVLEKLGEGGMGVVYKALDTRLDRLVALKVLAPARLADPEFRRTFAQEAKAASALNHPNIVTVYGVESSAGLDYIAMEYVGGGTLDGLIAGKGLRIGDGLKYAIQIADAISAAHSAGIVHRDLKPHNIAITEKRQIKILDFGLAKLSAPGSQTATVTQTVTGGKIAGTAAYMSPEQAEGKPVDARADIFAFGIVLYEMFTGRNPFLRENQAATLASILRDDPPVPPELPQELTRLITRCLRKDPERRLQHLDDARLVLEDLKSEFDTGQITSDGVLRPGATSRPRRLRLALAAAAVLLVASAAIGWYFTRNEATRQSAPVSVPFTTYLGNEVQPTFSPDGNQVAFVWDGERQDNPDIYVKLIGGAENPLRLTSDPALDLSPAWSPDGRFIAFLRDKPLGSAGVFLVSAIGGLERLVCELRTPLAISSVRYVAIAPFPLLAWAPDGKSIVFVNHNSAQDPLALYVVSADGGEGRRLTSPPPGSMGDGAPAFSPDGRTLVFSRAANSTASELYRLALTPDLRADGEPRRLTVSKAWNANPAWMTGGDIVFTRSNWYLGSSTLMRMPGTGGDARPVPGVGGDAVWPAVSTRARRLVFSRTLATQNIWHLPLQNGRAIGAPRNLIASTRAEAAPQYSSDGKRIAFTSSRSGQPEIWVAASDGSKPVQLTSLGAPVTGSPHWSPDGKQIVFDSDPDGNYDIYVVNAEGGSPRRLTTEPSDEALACFSRDGESIYFSSSRTGRWQVWKMPAAGGGAVQITHSGGRAPVEAPDGSLIYENEYELWTLPAGGGAERRLLDSVGFLNFAVTSEGIYFLRDAEVDPGRVIRLLQPATGKVSTVYEIGSPVDAGLAVSPDRRTLLFANVVQRGSDLVLVENFR